MEEAESLVVIPPVIPDLGPSPPPIAPFTSEDLVNEKFMKGVFQHLKDRFKNDQYFKWVLIGGSVYVVAHFSHLDGIIFWPVRKTVEFCFKKFWIPRSIIVWAGEVEPEIPFGRLGYTRCLESDSEVMEKFGIPSNTQKCLRDGITYLPGEFYQQFDLNEFDPKITPLAWSYGPITDPSLIMPTGWYNDMSGENQEFEQFCRFMKIFGYLPPEAYTELYRQCKIQLLRSGQRLIKIGDPDDKAYIIMSGAVDVYSNRIGPHGDFVRLRTAMQGGHITSLFSIVDAISGNERTIRSVYAVSKLNTTKVLVFPFAALKDYLVRNQEYVVSSVVRLLERGYRFQYQILHVAMQLTGSASILDVEPLSDPPDVDMPSAGKALSDGIRVDAIQGFMNFLGIDDVDYLNEHCKVLLVEPEEPTNDKDAIHESILNKPETAYKFVYIGKLEEFHLKSNLGPMERRSRRKIVEEAMVAEGLAHITSGQGVGALSGILGYFNVLFYRCVERSIVVALDRSSLQILLKRNPLAIFSIAFIAVYRMSNVIRAMDFAMEWTCAKEGQYIYHKQEMCYNSYLILSGRARAYELDSELHHRSIVEYKENDWIGLIESLLQSKRRSKTCVVIRETEFVKIPNDLLRNILMNYSNAGQVMLNFLVQRSLTSRKFEMYNDIERPHLEADSFRESRRIHSIALVPVAENLPYSVLALEIKRHYVATGTSCVTLTYQGTLDAMNMEELTIMEQFVLEMYVLSQLEKHELAIFVCLPSKHYWNDICSCHSEVMITVGCSELPNISTKPSEYEEDLVGRKISARRKELIILHRMDVVLPRNTKEWLYSRDWLHFHHHIRLPNEAFDLLGNIPEEEIVEKYPALEREISITSDLSRFIRWLQGRTFGVLFSSGGSRIGAQLGMLHALIEYKHIPIDMVVGTGSGFLLAALYAVYQDYATVQKIIEKVFKDFQHLTKLQWDDITFPYINLGTGKRLLTYFYQLFGSVQLEDTWIPICCVTTNLTSQDVRVDRSGPIWVFIRASLSHINRSPPICDPVDGDYICDGAHANSLPQDIMKEYGAEYIIAFNTVGGKAESADTKGDPNVSITRFIKNSISAFAQKIGLANPPFEQVFNQLALTQTRMYATGIEAVSNLKHIVYVRPPVEHWHSQTWSGLPSLHRIGYFYMKAILAKNPYREDIPFFVFWSKIKTTSKDMASEGGRDLKNFNITLN